MTVPTKEEVLQRIREDFQKSGLSDIDSDSYTCFLEGWTCASLFYLERIDSIMKEKNLDKST